MTIERKIRQINVTFDNGMTEVFSNHQFSRFEMKDGDLIFWIGSYNKGEGFIKTAIAKGFWKRIDIVYE